MLDLEYNYDKKHDILYISIGTPKSSYGEEEIEGIILRKDMNTDELNGITIIDFMKRLTSKDNNLNNLPIKLDFTELIRG